MSKKIKEAKAVKVEKKKEKKKADPVKDEKKKGGRPKGTKNKHTRTTTKKKIVEFLENETGLKKTKILSELKKGKLLVKEKPKFTNWEEIEKMGLMLAEAGLKVSLIANMLPVARNTFKKHLKEFPEYAKQLESYRMKRFLTLYASAIKKVKEGYFPAIQYLMDKGFGDLLEKNHEADEEMVDAKKENKLDISIMKVDPVDLGVADPIKNEPVKEENTVNHETAEDLGEDIIEK